MRPTAPEGTPATVPPTAAASPASWGSGSRRSRSVADATAVEVGRGSVRAGTVPDIHRRLETVAHDRHGHVGGALHSSLRNGSLLGQKRVEHVLDEGVAIPHPDPETREFVTAPGVDERLDSPVTRGAPTELDLHAPEGKIGLVVHHDDIAGRDAMFAGQLRPSLPAQVHERLRTRCEHVVAVDGSFTDA